MHHKMIVMEKSVCVLVALVLFSLCHCFTVSKCTPTVSNPNSNNLQWPSSEDVFANIVNAPAVDFNDSDTIDYNSSDVNLDGVESMTYTQRWEHLHERKKHRLFIIQNRIKDLLGFPRKANITRTHISDRERQRMAHIFEIFQTHKQPSEPDDISAERVQSFYPSCSIPRNTDRELWEDPQLFHMYYDITSSPQLVQSTSLSVSSAKLRLFKSNMLSSAECEVVPDDQSREMGDQNERLRISIFQYVRPLKRNRKIKKKKLVDSRMVSSDYAGWIDFDVGSAIRDWLENNNKNLGLEVVLEDSLANTQNASLYLHNMNCTNAADPPFPRFMEGNAPLNQIEPTLFENETYPTLDLRTVEIVEMADGDNSKTNVGPRYKRSMSTSDCSWDNLHVPCCAVDIYVSFQELGYTSIVAPAGFYSKMCVGVCTDSKDVSNNTLESKATCKPSETGALMVLYYNDADEITLKNIPGIIDKACSCSST